MIRRACTWGSQSVACPHPAQEIVVQHGSKIRTDSVPVPNVVRHEIAMPILLGLQVAEVVGLQLMF